jgi:hypothetical protein
LGKSHGGHGSADLSRSWPCCSSPCHDRLRVSNHKLKNYDISAASLLP